MSALDHLRAAASLALTAAATKLLDVAARVEGPSRRDTELAVAPDEGEDENGVPYAADPGAVSIGPESQAMIDAYINRPAPKRESSLSTPPPLVGSLAARFGGNKP